jgi:organic radical activating enzyme
MSDSEIKVFKNLIDKSKETFCLAPWINFAIHTDNTYRICCNMKNVKKIYLDEDSNLESIINNEYVTNIRRKMLNNEYVSECENCYISELFKKKSSRIEYNENDIELKKQILFKKKETIKLKDISIVDFRFNNKCNFACKTCNSEHSSRWEKALNKKQIKKDESIEKKIIENLKNNKIDPKLFYFAGGEPLINDFHWEAIDFLIENKRFDVSIFYNTNLSVLKYKNNDFIEKLKNFKNVLVSASCDSLYRKGEYIRYGFKHQNFINNINELKKNNFKYSITTVVSFLNLIYLNDFLNDLIDNNINQDISFIIAIHNNSNDFFNMPQNLFDKIILEINKAINNPRINNENKFFFKNLNNELIKKHFFDEKKFKKILFDLNKIDTLFNKLSFKDSLPELYDLIKNHL